MTTKSLTQSKNDKVIRIQGDRLCDLLHLSKGTKLDLALIKLIANAGSNQKLEYDHMEFTTTMSMVGIAQILLSKIEGV